MANARGSLRELLYSDSASPGDRPKNGFVTLVFEANAGEQTKFSRVITPSSSSADALYTSQYRVNGRTVTAEAYTRKLESFGILVKARNFLVFQVRVPLIASRLCSLSWILEASAVAEPNNTL